MHRSVARNALVILKNDGKEAQSIFYKKNKDFYYELMNGTTDPDKYEKAAGTHYYVYPGKGTVNTGQYYPNAKHHSSPMSARLYLEKHFANATKLYKTGNKKSAFLEIGRACHYLGDIGCPPHSAGIQYTRLYFLPNYHKLFETYANDVAREKVEDIHATTANGLYGCLDDPGYALNELCEKAASEKNRVRTLSESIWLPAIKRTSKLSEQYTAVLLERFYREVNN